MSWNGSGTFTRTNGQFIGDTVWSDDLANSIKIVASRHDVHDEDLADGINNCLAKDGQNAMTGNLDLGTFTLENINALGIGTNSPDGTVHIHSGSAGTVAAPAGVDELVVEGAGDGGITILAPAANYGTLNFGAPGDASAAYVSYQHSNTDFDIATNTLGGILTLGSGIGVTAITIDASQDVTFAGDVNTAAGTLTAGAIAGGAITGTTIGGKTSVQEEINGGSTGQYLTKNSNTDRDFVWSTLTPSAVADNFQAIKDGDLVLPGLGAAITDWTEDLNEGSAYTFNATTGILTINTSGTYQIFANLAIGTSTAPVSDNQVRIGVYKNGSQVTHSFAEAVLDLSGNTTYHNILTQVLMTMVATDTLQLRATSSSGTETMEVGDALSTFQVVRVA